MRDLPLPPPEGATVRLTEVDDAELIALLDGGFVNAIVAEKCGCMADETNPHLPSAHAQHQTLDGIEEKFIHRCVQLRAA